MIFRIKLRIEFHDAIGTDAVGQLEIGMGVEILLDFTPVPLVVPDLLAVATDGQKAAEYFDFLKRFFQFLVFDSKFRLGPLDF
jgi:hypothetical protein